jgi:nucleotide-binding universal stress UspA family protein
MFKKILVCLDGSKLAEQIIPHAVDVAITHKAKMTLFRVMPLPVAVAPGAPGVPIETPMTPEVEAEAKNYLLGVAGPIAEKGISTEVVIQQGTSPGGEIVNYANENAVDLIALATHGRSGLGRAVFGSVADFVLRESGLPILLVRPKGNDLGDNR